MTFALTACFILLTVGFLILLDRKDARAAAERTRILEQLGAERAGRRREVGDLLQRIQAPQLAVARHDVERAVDDPAGTPPVADEEWFAEHREHAEYIARVEALENAPFDRA